MRSISRLILALSLGAIPCWGLLSLLLQVGWLENGPWLRWAMVPMPILHLGTLGLGLRVRDRRRCRLGIQVTPLSGPPPWETAARIREEARRWRLWIPLLAAPACLLAALVLAFRRDQGGLGILPVVFSLFHAGHALFAGEGILEAEEAQGA